MSRSLVLVSLFFLSSVFGSVEIAWKNNLTISNHDLSGRLTVLTSTSGVLGAVYNGLSYYSLSYQVSQGQAQGDGVYGAAYTSLGAPLSTYLTYFDVSANWGGSANPTGADVSAAANLIGAAYLALVEVDDNGNVLGGVRMKSLSWTVTGVQVVEPIKFATFTGTSLQAGFNNFSISFTFVASDQAGTLTNGAVVTSKSLQTTINILNFPFTISTSKLRLIVGVGTASGSASGTVRQSGTWNRLSAGSGKSAVYFDGATHAFVNANGDTKTVSVVSTGAGTADFDGAGFLSQLASISAVQHSLVVDYRFVNITFDQSDNITYDPSIGVSDSLYNAGAALRVQTPLIALASLLAFVFAKAL